MSKLTDRIQGLLDAGKALGDDNVRVTTAALHDILADVQELERIAECRPVASYAAGVKAGKREAYEHALSLTLLPEGGTKRGDLIRRDIEAAINALDTDGDT